MDEGQHHGITSALTPALSPKRGRKMGPHLVNKFASGALHRGGTNGFSGSGAAACCQISKKRLSRSLSWGRGPG